MTMPTWLRHAANDFFNLLMPPACALCLEILDPPDPDTFCRSCREQIVQPVKPACPRCALPFPADSGPDHHCQTCLLEKKVSFTSVAAIGPYDGLLREAVHRFKYRNTIHLDRPLAALLADRLSPQSRRYDLVAPIPLHRSKLRQRGYNQSALLARQLAQRLKLPLDLDLLDRSRPALPQQGLSARDRLVNIKSSFRLGKELQGESILLIDDVMTTGATARECARILLAGGAGVVHVAVLARAALR